MVGVLSCAGDRGICSAPERRGVAGLHASHAAGVRRRHDLGQAMGDEEARASGCWACGADGARRCVLFDLPGAHIHAGRALRVVWVRVVPDATMASSIALMVVSLAVSAAAGWLCYRWVERPLTKWISRRRLVIRLEVVGENL